MIVASWKQRRKQVPYRQPAGDGPAPGYTPTHTLSHSPTVSFFSILAQDFFFRAPWTAACLPFWRGKWKTGAMSEAAGSGCRPVAVGFLPRWCKKTGARNGFIWCQSDRSLLSRRERMENKGLLETSCELVFLYIYYMFQWEVQWKGNLLVTLWVVGQIELCRCCYFDFHAVQISLVLVNHCLVREK